MAEIKKLHGVGPNAIKAKGWSFTVRKYRNGVKMILSDSEDDMSPSQHITNYIAGLSDWRGKMLARLRQLVLDAAPEISENWKWDTPVWSQKGNVVAVAAFKDYIKLNFFKGASLEDPQSLFNAGLEAKATRAIDLKEGDEINEAALKELIRAAVAFNVSGGKKK